MNNQVEGRIFVSATFAANTTTPDYIQNLFPGLSRIQSELVAFLYQGIGFDTVFDQVVQVMGDCKCFKILDVRLTRYWCLQQSSFARLSLCCDTSEDRHSRFVCLIIFVKKNWANTGWLGRICYSSRWPWKRCHILFPWDNVGFLILLCRFSMVLSGDPRLLYSGPPFNNTQFDASFSESFLAVVKSFNPNETPNDPNNITPNWLTFSNGNFEMLFNRTESGQPIVRPFTTDPRLLARCRWVIMLHYHIYSLFKLFW